MITLLSAVGSLLSFRVRSRASLDFELLALRHQLTVLRRQRFGPLRPFSTDRLLWVWLYRIWPQVLNTMVVLVNASITSSSSAKPICAGFLADFIIKAEEHYYATLDQPAMAA